MPEPRLSVLIVARDEAHNLAGCLASASWADERVVVVDPASRDATLAIARRDADVVAVRGLRRLRQPAERRAGAGLGRLGALDRRRRAGDRRRWPPRSGGSSPIARAAYHGYRVPIRSVILGRPFAFSGTQHDRRSGSSAATAGRWVGLVHETVELDGPAGSLATRPAAPHASRHAGSFWTRSTTTRRWRRQAWPDRSGASATSDLTLRPFWTFLKLYLVKQGFRDGVEGFMFCALSGVSVAVRAWKHRELTLGEEEQVLMIQAGTRPTSPPGSTRCTAGSSARWRRRLPAAGHRRALSAAGRPARPRPGLRQGPVCRALRRHGGPRVVGLDLSAAMLAAEADRAGSRPGRPRRLPFGPASFDRVMAVEVFEHLRAAVARRGLWRGAAGAPARRDLRRRRQERGLVDCATRPGCRAWR